MKWLEGNAGEKCAPRHHGAAIVWSRERKVVQCLTTISVDGSGIHCLCGIVFALRLCARVLVLIGGSWEEPPVYCCTMYLLLYDHPQGKTAAVCAYKISQMN